LLEAKYVDDPNNSPYVIGSKVRESQKMQQAFVSNPNNPKNLDSVQDNEFRRYGLALRAPETVNPFVKLEVITNAPESFSYWQFWINKNNVPNATIVPRPWP
jgi:hypothetical protein